MIFFRLKKSSQKVDVESLGVNALILVLKQKQCKCISVHAHVPLSKATLFWEQLSVLKKFSFACD